MRAMRMVDGVFSSVYLEPVGSVHELDDDDIEFVELHEASEADLLLRELRLMA